MEYVALILGLAGVVMAWLCNRKNADLKERIAETNSRIYRLRRENEETQAKAEKDLMALKFELLKLKGDLRVEPSMKIGEILAIHPQAQQVLSGFHLGGCSSCAIDEQQSLAEAAALNGRELEPILVSLNALITESDSGNGQAAPDRVRIPNVQLHF